MSDQVIKNKNRNLQDEFYKPGVGVLQDPLGLVAYDFLSQIIQHSHSQQNPAKVEENVFRQNKM